MTVRPLKNQVAWRKTASDVLVPAGGDLGGRMNKKQVNPWAWQDQFGFSQAWRVDGAQSIVFVSGQAPISPEGALVGEGDFEAQTRQVFENLRTVLTDAGASLEAIVKITVYLTDIARLPDLGRIKADF